MIPEVSSDLPCIVEGMGRKPSPTMACWPAGTVGMAEHSMPIGELGGKSACQRILGIIGLAKLASTSVLAVITSAEKVPILKIHLKKTGICHW